MFDCQLQNAKSFANPLFDKIAPGKREAVITAAVEEFAEKGFSAANTNVIAQKAQISVGALYKYFTSKEDLYLTVVQMGHEKLEHAVTPILDSSVNIVKKIRMLVDALFDYSRTEVLWTRLYNRFTAESSPDLAARLAEKLESFTARRYADMLTHEIEDKNIASGVDGGFLAFCIDNVMLVMQFSLTAEYYRDRMQMYLGDKMHDDNYLKEQLFTLFMRMIGLSSS